MTVTRAADRASRDLILEALHANNVPFINGGRGVPWAPEIPIWVSLTFIATTIAVTAVWSLIASHRQARASAVEAAVVDEAR